MIERPAARDIVAHGKEVIVVGAGDAGPLIVREMLRQPSLGYTPIGLVDDDPRKTQPARSHGDPRARHDRRPAARSCATTGRTRC